MNEYESEPVRGLPERLPDGESMVWQGAPRWQGLAQRAFHARKAALYFGFLAGLHVAFQAQSGVALVEALKGAAWLALLGAAAVGLLLLLGWLYSRTTVYTITNHRLVMRFGVAIPMMINIPLSRIEAADLKRFTDGSGDILFTLAAGQKTAYWMIWPHARPWHFFPAQPMLRSVPEAERVAAMLADVIRDGAEQCSVKVPLSDAGKRRPTPRPAPAGTRSAALS
jgi:hypothetical protein